MRAFSLLGLLLVLALVLMLVKREMRIESAPSLALQPVGSASAPRNAREQSQLIQQQVRQAVENATGQPLRNTPADVQ